MSDFNPTTIYFILSESMGGWLWVLVALAFILLTGIVSGGIKLRKAGRPARRPLTAAIVAGLAVTAIFAFLVPVWTLAGPGALVASVDYVAAILLALVPGASAGALVFFLAASKCATRSSITFENT